MRFLIVKHPYQQVLQPSSSHTGFHGNSNFNERQSGFHDRETGPNQRGGRGSGSRNWRDDDSNSDRRNFQPKGAGNFERKSSRWMDNQRSDDWDEDEQQQDQHQQDQQQQPRENSPDQREQNSRNDDAIDDNGGGGENEPSFQQSPKLHEEAPPGTEDRSFNDEPANDSTSNQPDESYVNHNQNDLTADQSGGGGSDDNAAGNTTPLCDEDETKE